MWGEKEGAPEEGAQEQGAEAQETGAEAEAGAQSVCAACCLRAAQPPRTLPTRVASAAHSMGLEISSLNSLPSVVCNECFVSIHKFYLFRERSKKSHSILVDYLKTLKANEAINFDILKNEREKIFPSLTRSKTVVYDVRCSESSNRCNTDEIKCTNTTSEFNYLNNTVKDEYFDENLNSRSEFKTSESSSSPSSNKSDLNLSIDFLDELPLRISIKKENKFENATPDNDEKKREAKELGERKRVLDTPYQESENDLINFGDDDSSMDVPIITKKIKKSRDSKHKKRKEKVKIKTDVKNSTQIVASNKKLSNRMVLETEQYKVIKLNRDEILAEMATNANNKRYLNSPHKCTLCVKGFNYEDVLQNHMTKHEPKSNYFECDLCHQFLPSAVSMRGHKKSHSTKYQCKICDVIKASRQHLLEHYMLVHDGAPRTYICNVCGKMLTKRTMFQKHMRVHYPSNKIACDKCGKLFKTIETLRAHMLHHEGGSLTRHTDVKPFSCDQCFKAFRYASLLYTHKITHLTTRNYYCVECDVRFKTQSNLRLHLRKSLKHVDPDLLKFGCDQCDRRYEDEKSLRRHIEWVHLRQKNYKCSKCDMQFGSPDGLRSHMKKIHDGIRPPPNHVCKICNRAFRAKAVLVKHIRVHTGERPYECQECGKKFAQNSTMSTHIKLVHLKMQRQVNRKKSTDIVQIPKKPLQETAVPPTFTYHSSPSENPDSTYFYGTGSAQSAQIMRPNPAAPFPKYQDDPRQAI